MSLAARAVEDVIRSQVATGHVELDASSAMALERALRDSEAELRAMFETATCGRGYADPTTGRLLQVNAKLREITGRTEDQLRELTWLDFLHPADRTRHVADWERLRRGHSSEVAFDARCVRPDGSLVRANVWAAVVRDEGWRPLRTIVTLRELDARESGEP